MTPETGILARPYSMYKTSIVVVDSMSWGTFGVLRRVFGGRQCAKLPTAGRNIDVVGDRAWIGGSLLGLLRSGAGGVVIRSNGQAM